MSGVKLIQYLIVTCIALFFARLIFEATPYASLYQVAGLGVTWELFIFCSWLGISGRAGNIAGDCAGFGSARTSSEPNRGSLVSWCSDSHSYDPVYGACLSIFRIIKRQAKKMRPLRSHLKGGLILKSLKRDCISRIERILAINNIL